MSRAVHITPGMDLTMASTMTRMFLSAPMSLNALNALNTRIILATCVGMGSSHEGMRLTSMMAKSNTFHPSRKYRRW